jgi:hypothetical protein
MLMRACPGTSREWNVAFCGGVLANAEQMFQNATYERESATAMTGQELRAPFLAKVGGRWAVGAEKRSRLAGLGGCRGDKRVPILNLALFLEHTLSC